jgi:hypothetical protein
VIFEWGLAGAMMHAILPVESFVRASGFDNSRNHLNQKQTGVLVLRVGDGAARHRTCAASDLSHADVRIAHTAQQHVDRVWFADVANGLKEAGGVSYHNK